ncbi:MAG: membrane-bound lytic murein transglycosylase MltF [Propionivibrio sp.]|uniref:membrane-bound lytic murein transglycosylase MltF n=1 Tax=Propionivibrio sp. TaxID=2212460 RepID=UPI001A492B84|nr:membrane-bound lytic murein transglycosylase MltF [Propionivibrio sp.]MBL8416015.1 membrane-bound lytic murein transglycosylase MltF [Propionivibrio sp.]
MRLVLIFLAVLIAGCGDKVQQSPYKTGELVILTRVGSTTYSLDETGGASGFDYDLARLLAQELKLKSRIVVAANDYDIMLRLKGGEGHLAAAWLTAVDDAQIRSSTPYFQSQNVLITHEASLPLTGIEQLAHKTIHVVAGSRQEKALLAVKDKVPDLIIAADPNRNDLDLMEGVAMQRYEATLVNNAEFDIGSNYYPELQDSLGVGPARAIVWLFAPGVDPELITRANAFLEHLEKSGEMDRLKDRYFGHVQRLTQADSVRFIERMRSVLPQYRALFHAAQARTGIDWRLLAALAYQESQWEPLATSPTGVRGMMMLTADTADHLGVSNRLDPSQSIRAGALYLSDLRDTLPPGVGEPDRLWLALAAYNLGMGHLNAARHIAITKKTDPDSWYEMKKVLPLLAQAQYYSRLKSGRGRGGEAVTMVENIRIYTDILNRHEGPYRPLDRIAETTAFYKTRLEQNPSETLSNQ